MYQWPQISVKTSEVYALAIANSRQDTMSQRLQQYYRCGAIFGKLCCCVAAVDAMYLAILQWLEPAHAFDLAPDAPASQPASNLSRVRN